MSRGRRAFEDWMESSQPEASRKFDGICYRDKAVDQLWDAFCAGIKHGWEDQ
jgi:hypothetical protein